jgi:hypothetical protein
MPKQVKMRHCCICNAELGVYDKRDHDPLDTCGAVECDRAVREALAAERDEAHRRLDEEQGW